MKFAWSLTALLATSLLSPFSANAQDYGLAGPSQIESETLGAAQDFDAGILQDGALDTNLWQGTSAARAAKLLSKAPLKSKNPLIHDMVRTVVLSGGVPPQARSATGAQAYESARLQAVLAIEAKPSGEASALEGFLARNPELAKAPLAQVDLAFSKGDWRRACEISDTVTTERAKPEWARLRATCHGLRGETSAADVTRDLLRSGGYNNLAYHAQMDALLTGTEPAQETDPTDSLVTFLANRNTESLAGAAPGLAGPNPSTFMVPSQSASIFTDFAETDLASLQSKFGNLSFNVSLPDLDLETALSDPTPRATGRLFVLGQSGDALALDKFISRAVRAGVSEDQVLLKLAPMIQGVPAQGRANLNLARYTRAATLAEDIASLQQLYSALPNGPAQARIALVADALGGGFYGQALGRDIEDRLKSPVQKSQAVTDAQIALALGANLSDTAAELLSDQFLPALTLPQNQLLLLNAATRDDSRAEITLMVAALMSRGNLNTTDKAYLINVLTESGLQRFAGRIAADVYSVGLNPNP